MYSVDFRFLSSVQNSSLFLAHYIPDSGKAASNRKAVVFVPPFAEELNRSKRMFVLCARQLASAGLDAVCFDYAGTGDSYGNWGEFELSDWQANLTAVCDYLYNSGINDVSLVALRFGALVAAETISTGNVSIAKCVLWDPVENGEGFIRQLIRLKIAAAMAEEAKKISTKDVQAAIDQQGFVEIAGYSLSAPLIDSIKKLKLRDTIEAVVENSSLYWVTLTGKNQASKSSFRPASLPEGLEKQVSIQQINDVRFWMQQEVTVAPTLLQKTSEIFNDTI